MENVEEGDKEKDESEEEKIVAESSPKGKGTVEVSNGNKENASYNSIYNNEVGRISSNLRVGGSGNSYVSETSSSSSKMKENKINGRKQSVPAKPPDKPSLNEELKKIVKGKHMILTPVNKLQEMIVAGLLRRDGDFNAYVDSGEKRGGATSNRRRMLSELQGQISLALCYDHRPVLVMLDRKDEKKKASMPFKFIAT
ncbi:uncharacterized protein G2W53_040708 [Senna tora]|uniref:Uncharacterized protein n=1 Tax=Senna tora TaxID=362788 RepID=A0A834SDW8_9FABA|nr:uncharacterized protein G2W53_040708 [Senna tora]